MWVAVVLVYGGPMYKPFCEAVVGGLEKWFGNMPGFAKFRISKVSLQDPKTTNFAELKGVVDSDSDVDGHFTVNPSLQKLTDAELEAMAKRLEAVGVTDEELNESRAPLCRAGELASCGGQAQPGRILFSARAAHWVVESRPGQRSRAAGEEVAR